MNHFKERDHHLKTLVTGGTGFVGRYLVRELISQGSSCRLLIRPTSDTSWLNGTEDVELWEGDLTRPHTLVGIAKRVDYVFHLAAEGHVSAMSEEAFNHFTRINVEGTKNLLSGCKNHAVKKFVHFSSTAAMGLIKKKLVDESDAPRPTTPYQKSKLKSEQVALQLGKDFGVPTVAVRPCMIYGMNGKGEFYKICRLMRKGMFPKVGRGRNLTPLVHVKDVVQGAIKGAENGIAGEVYLLASDCSIDLNEMRSLVMEAWGTKAIYPYVPVWFMFFVAWCFELLAELNGKAPIATTQNVASTVWDRQFSIEKAKRELGYVPNINFRDGIFETVNWFKLTN